MPFWGSVDDCADSEICRNLMKIGRYQERLDLYVRLHYSMAEVERTYCKLRTRIEKSGLPYHAEQLDCIGACLASEETFTGEPAKAVKLSDAVDFF